MTRVGEVSAPRVFRSEDKARCDACGQKIIGKGRWVDDRLAHNTDECVHKLLRELPRIHGRR